MAKGWTKTTIVNDAGIRTEAQAPVIVSASRSTDIPAFYADWFFDRLDKGYSAWVNPFNGVRSYVSYEKTRFIVFWSKNPQPLLSHIDKLKNRGIGCYVQFTLNDYVDERLEPGVPPVQQRIDTFRRLVDKLGYGGVVWRFDPLVLTDTITPDVLLEKIDAIAGRLKGYTEKLVFSFADIMQYRKVKNNLEKSGINYKDWTEPEMIEMASRMSAVNSQAWQLELATCGEKLNLDQFGIAHNQCVDDSLIVRRAYNDAALMDFLGMKKQRFETDLFSGDSNVPAGAIHLSGSLYAIRHGDNSDKGQREFCGCIVSKDIGAYNTCAHMCEYCYANTSKKSALANWKRHIDNSNSESIL